MDILLFFTTLFRGKKIVYNLPAAIVFLVFGTTATVFLIQSLWTTLLLMPTKYYIIMIVVGVIDIYMAFDMYCIANMRGDKFYDHEVIYAYYCIYTDFMF